MSQKSDDVYETTEVEYENDSKNKYTRTYFNEHFYIDNASIYKRLTLRFLIDERASIFLNEIDIFETNIIKGPIVSKMINFPYGSDKNENIYYEAIIDGKYLANGENLFQIKIPRSEADILDTKFSFELTGSKEILQPLSPAKDILIEENAFWRSLDNYSNEDNNWSILPFNDLGELELQLSSFECK